MIARSSSAGARLRRRCHAQSLRSSLGPAASYGGPPCGRCLVLGMGRSVPPSTSTICSTGNTLTANAGTNLHELMLRMGNASPRAAMIYLHSTGRDIEAHGLLWLVRQDGVEPPALGAGFSLRLNPDVTAARPREGQGVRLALPDRPTRRSTAHRHQVKLPSGSLAQGVDVRTQLSKMCTDVKEVRANAW